MQAPICTLQSPMSVPWMQCTVTEPINCVLWDGGGGGGGLLYRNELSKSGSGVYCWQGGFGHMIPQRIFLFSGFANWYHFADL